MSFDQLVDTLVMKRRAALYCDWVGETSNDVFSDGALGSFQKC